MSSVSHPAGLPDLFLDRSLGRITVPGLLRRDPLAADQVIDADLHLANGNLARLSRLCDGGPIPFGRRWR